MNSSDLPDILLGKHHCILSTLYKSTQYTWGSKKKVKSKTNVTSRLEGETEITRDMEKPTKMQLKILIAYKRKLKE